MKIYNKKTFASGTFMVLLAAINLIVGIMKRTMDVKGGIVMAALFLGGMATIVRSQSHILSKEDKLSELDERNQLVALKSKSKAFSVTQRISFLLMLIFFVGGKVSDCMDLIVMGVGLAFTFSIAMFTELFTALYYEAKN